MIIVVPISTSDRHRLHEWLKVHRKLGGLTNHKLVFSATKSCAGDAYSAAAEMNDICGSTKVITMDSDPEGGWPFAPNKHFHFTAVEMSQQSEPFFWMELDCYGIVPNWADSLASNYISNQKAVMGDVVSTPFRDKDNNIVVVEDDVMVCGCAIYPAWLAQHSVLINNLVKPTQTNPWDVSMRHELRAFGVAKSPLISDFWNTERYTWNGRQFSCEPAPSKFTSRSRGGLIPVEAVVVHGCKDGSLPSLLLEGVRTVFAPKIEEKPKVSDDQSDEIGLLRAEINRLRVENQELKMVISQQKREEAGPSTEEIVSQPASPVDLALSFLPDGKKQTLKKLAELTKTDTKTLLELIKANPDKFVGPSGPVSWVGATSI